MQSYLATADGYPILGTTPSPSDTVWLDYFAPKASELEAFSAQVLQFTGLSLQRLHVQDAANALHPSHYDGASQYDRVVFRSLLGAEIKSLSQKKARLFSPINTYPITFFIADRALITVQHFDATQPQAQLAGIAAKLHCACTPHELMLRFLNAQVDAYLALRQQLTEHIDHWQRELLDPRRSFNDWTALLDARLELRKLESLSEEQLDALQELREAWAEPLALPYEADERANLRVRLNDVMEHVGRVLSHARRLEASVESAIQLHFASVSHATNKTVSRLTVLTAIFAPMTLLTGFYGMNVPLPWQSSAHAYGWVLLGMVLSAGIVLGVFGGLKLWQSRDRFAPRSRDK